MAPFLPQTIFMVVKGEETLNMLFDGWGNDGIIAEQKTEIEDTFMHA